MNNTSLLLLLCFCSTITFAQNKKPKRVLPAPKVESVKPAETVEVKVEKAPVIWNIEPAPATQSRAKKEVVFDTLVIPANETSCACNNMALLLKSELNGIHYENMKGRVKQVITLEKRDTTVGYWETLSPGNEETTLYSRTGMLTEHTRKMIDRFSKKTLQFTNLISGLVIEYDEQNKPVSCKIYFIDTAKPLTTLLYSYKNDGLVSVESVVDKTSAAAPYDNKLKCLFFCSKTGNQLTMAKYEYNNDFNNKATMIVYNLQNQIIQKQEIEHRKDIGSKNKTAFFTYNSSGQLINKSLKQDDGSKQIVITYTYNTQGNVIKEQFADGDYTVYTYQYDVNKNWIRQQKTEYEKNSYSDKMEINSRLTRVRKIEYY